MIPVQRLETVCEIVMGQAPDGDSYNSEGVGMPLIAGAGDFDKFNPKPKKYTISPGKVCCAGDVILGIRATIGEKVIADKEYCVGRGVAALRAKSGLDSRYLWHLLTHIGPVLALKSRGATFKQVNRNDIAELEIKMLPISEQRRIAEVLDRAEALRATRRAALAQLDTLTQAIFLDMFGDPVANPKGWRTKPLPEICHCYSGGTPTKNNESFWKGSIPWFSPKDLKHDDLFDSQDHISADVPASGKLKLLSANTVAIVVRGMILAHTFPVSVLRIPATINQDLKALCPHEPIEAQFLAFCLRAQSKFVLQHVSEAGHGTKRLDTDGLAKIRILCTPHDIQHDFATQVSAIEKLKNTYLASACENDALFASLQYRAFRGEL